MTGVNNGCVGVPDYGRLLFPRQREVETEPMDGAAGLEFGSFSLERRRLRGGGDLIEVYKIMRGTDRVDSQKLFPPQGGRVNY